MEGPLRAGRSPARAAFGMGAVTVVSRLFGFLRVLVVAAVLGTTFLGNTFQSSNSFSNVLFELLAAGALSAVLVPTFVGLLDAGDDAEADRLAGAVLGVALAVLGVVTVIGVVGAPVLARFLSSGVSDPAVAAEQEELTAFLLRFFVPQILLYAFGTVATGLLYARRRFAITAAAPIGNTVAMVAFLVVFRVVAGPQPTLDLSFGERLLLAGAGTVGVVGFVGVLVGAAWHSGFSLRPRWVRGDRAVRGLLRMSAWGVALHAIVGLLLGAAIVVGNGVEGGVVAYQVAFVFFLAPYAVLAQPIHTTILPELSASRHGEGFAAWSRWGLDTIALLVVPVSAAFVALAVPAMRVLAFGAARDGVDLLAAGLASLGAGLFPYSAFLLLTRGYFALGDGRTPAIAAVVSGAVGVAVMVGVGVSTHGAARVAALGIGHSVAYLVGAVVLGVGLSRRAGTAIVPRVLPLVAVVSAVLGVAVWLAARALDPSGRVENAVMLFGLLLPAGALYLVFVRLVPSVRPLRPVTLAPEVDHP